MNDSTSNDPSTPLYDTTGGDPLAGRPTTGSGTTGSGSTGADPLITESYVPVPTTGTSGASGSGSTGSDGSGKADAAKGEAKAVAGDAKQAAAETAGTAKEQAGKVASEATGQAKQLFGQATSELRDQAGQQQQRVAQGLRGVGSELSSMADKSEDGGLASELVRNLSGRADSVAGWLEGRDPGSLLSDVKSFAARKPGTFIAIAAGAGLLAGRVVKSLTAEAKAEHESTGHGSTGTGATGGTTASGTTGTATSGLYGTPVAGHGTHVQGSTAGGSAAGVGPVAGEYDVVETGTVPGVDQGTSRGGASL